MTRIHIRETTSGVVPNTPVNLVVADQQSSAASGSRDGAKSPSPARRAVALGCAVAETGEGGVGGETAKRPGVSDESGFYEEDEAMACASSLQAEDSVEIIFDKNASNNNLGADGRSPNTGTVVSIYFFLKVELKEFHAHGSYVVTSSTSPPPPAFPAASIGIPQYLLHREQKD